MSDHHRRPADLAFRGAAPEDAGLVLSYMKKLGAYQKMSDEITATEAQLALLLGTGKGEAIFATLGGQAAGFMFFNETSSAFTGRHGLFLDGFFVEEDFRGQGIGKAMMEHLCRLVRDRGGEMLEWGCLDWNRPALDFYSRLGAYRLDTLGTYRLGPDRIATLAWATNI
ncbi:GNAT family N-acetyltransferase [Frigidibacter sp. RF13]|uniref:GNAT family N-acetyltransferase n=1 Tax=Frigidibacter sp. RF13 TaxID=2997340 RepID=UPI0022713768|nr:GNAT family N-acetyltransferase [Frigidibacter sp. RF13]MCY1126378.1 GNAT family N-acetyltransferase [Frigidibacter sp. RF13]